MAGATNRAFKAAGIPKSAIKELRVTGGRGLSLRSAISMAGQRGIEIPQKAHDFLAKRDAKSGQKTKPAADDGTERQRRDAARAEARDVYERGNAGARERLAGLRGTIRQRVQDVRDAEGTLKGAKDHAESTARRTVPAAKGGPKKRQNERDRDRAIESKVANDPSVQRAAMQAKQARMRLQSALADRDATARARKQQRGAESGGQMDLFSGAPKPRAASPFERRMALRDARGRALGDLSRGMLARRKAGAAAPASAPTAKPLRDLSGMSRSLMAARKAGPDPKQLIRAAERKHAHGFSVQSYRNDARRALVDVGTARAKRDAALKKAAQIEAETKANPRGRSAYDEGMRRASHFRFEASRASEQMAKHMKSARNNLKVVRKVEKELPPQVRSMVRPKRDTSPISSGASPEARAKMASAKARIGELRAARGERLKRQIVRAEAVRVATDNMMRDQAARANNVMPVRGPSVEKYNRAARSLNRAATSARRQFGDRGDFVVKAAKSSGESRGKKMYLERLRASREASK